MPSLVQQAELFEISHLIFFRGVIPPRGERNGESLSATYSMSFCSKNRIDLSFFKLNESMNTMLSTSGGEKSSTFSKIGAHIQVQKDSFIHILDTSC